jgi:hypothetical protein
MTIVVRIFAIFVGRLGLFELRRFGASKVIIVTSGSELTGKGEG